MGYYSEIGLCLNKAAHDKMLAELTLQDEDVQAEVQDLFLYAEKRVANQDTDNEATLYHWPWIKWYSSFVEVKFIESFMEKIGDDDDSEMQYRFIHIGEEIEDIAAHGSYHENPFEMDVGRGVYINEAHSPIKRDNFEKCE